MSVVSRKPIVIAGAIGLVLSAGAQAAGPSAGAPADQRAREHPDHSRTVTMLEKPAKRFHRSLRIVRRKARRDRAAQAVNGSGAPGGSLPSPESVGVSPATLDSIAACESGGDPTAVSADGSYRGKYQFDYGTWASVGGSGDPAAAPEAEQDYRAALLYSRGGSSPWPICGS
jgi:soluble lytic murein transglycosylase-like protein